MRHLLFDGNQGVYIPQKFACDFLVTTDERLGADGIPWSGISDDDITYLRLGPDEEHYWEVWDTVLCNAYFIDPKGKRWTLFQDADLFAVSEDDPESDDFDENEPRTQLAIYRDLK